jgi:hypothetical protein
MYWDSFTSYFQLAGAFCLSYSVIETFKAGLDDIIFDRDSYSLEKATLAYSTKSGLQDYSKYIGHSNYDPLRQEIDNIIERHRVCFFLSFISCLTFIVYSGFERFYNDPLPNEETHHRILGLIFTPFLLSFILWIRIIVRGRVTNVDEIRIEFEEQSGKIFSPIPNLLRHVVILISGILIFLSVTLLCFRGISAMNIFSGVTCKIVIFWCILFVFMPFISQYIQMLRAKSRYAQLGVEYGQRKEAELRKKDEEIPQL